MLIRLLYLTAIQQIYLLTNAEAGRPKSRCEIWRAESFKVPFSYVPRCDIDGSFEPVQCHYTISRVRCWLVDRKGKAIGRDKTPYISDKVKHTSSNTPQFYTNRASTRTSRPLTNYASDSTFSFTRTDLPRENEVVERTELSTMTQEPKKMKKMTKCEKLRKRRLNQARAASVIPRCTPDGHFQREQCHVDMRKCWCVNENGKRIPGTKVRRSWPNCYPDVCGKRFEKRRSRHRRVVGGREAVPHTWPWQALVLFSDPKHICGGTLVKRNWLVTAASCFDGFPKRTSEWNVRLGGHKLKSRKERKLSVQSIHIHPQYKRGNETHPGDYDVALLQVSSSAKIPRNTMPLCLPNDDSFYQQGARCTITGWGHTSYNGTLSRVLREAWVDLVPLNECNSEKSYNGVINDRFMCAGYKEGGMDACHFDTGGPLACPIEGGSWVLAGIVSWKQTCAQPYKYGVYTNVHQVKSWIQKTVGR